MSSAKISWKDVKPVLAGFSSTQLLERWSQDFGPVVKVD
jgi:hypothetical protein